MDKVKVTDKYLKYRDNVLKYTNIDMNLELANDERVYIAADLFRTDGVKAK